MLLYSFSFFVFFFLVFVLFWKLRKQFQWIILLLASYYFYVSWKPAYLGIIILTTLICYFCAKAIESTKNNKKFYLFLALIFSLGSLFIFQYLDFFSITVNQVFGFSLPQFKILLPLGISFYTLTVIGYMIDVYKGKIKPEKHLGHFALFVSFFPKITAGPIERGANLLPQLKKKFVFDYALVSEGARLFMLGLFKKMVIADNLGIIVDRGFGSLSDYKGLSLILIIFFYSWQIYMDFSGYTDMARGIGKMLGINLMENFNLPYLSSSIQDFWRRWHISFSSWLRDYIYFPLGGNRKGLIRTVINTLIVFTISGLWHGAGWTFIIWGVLHGLGLSFERVLKALYANRLTIKIPNILKIAYAYCLISIFWVFFRSPTINDAIYILRNAPVGLKHFLSPNYLWASLMQLFVFDRIEMIITFGVVLIAILLEIMQRKTSILKIVSKQPMIVRFTIYILVIFMIIQLRNANIPAFIYTQF